MAEYRHYRSSITPLSRKAGLVACSLAAIAFLIACSVINLTIAIPSVWRPNLDAIDAKLAAFKQSKEDFDVLVCGPSHVEYGVNPEILDPLLESQGLEVCTFNLGLEGMKLAEREFVLRRALELSKGRVKYLIVEFELRATPLVKNLYSARTRYFSSPRYIGNSLRTKLFSKRSLAKRIGASSVICCAFVLNQMNLGVVPDLLLPKVNDPEVNEAPSNFSSFGWKNGDSRLNRRNLAKIEDSLLRATETTKTNRILTGEEFSSIEQDLEIIEKFGCVPIVLFAPCCDGIEEDLAIRNYIQAHRPDLLVLDFTPSGPDWPSFCDAELWFDSGHLASSGAEVFSRLLAQRLSSKLSMHRN